MCNSNQSTCGRTWYCAGPFWDPECKKFFDEFKQRINETTMVNSDHVDECEPVMTCGDSVFMPGHYEVNFPEIKKSYDVSSFKRVLTQILYLDTTAGIDGKNIVVYVPGYDLGTMFEVGYYISQNYAPGNPRSLNYNILRRQMILHKTDEKMNDAIEKLMEFLDKQASKYWVNADRVAIVDKSVRVVDQKFDEVNCLAIRMDNSSEDPFNAMVAGAAYAINIPFITYSLNETKSNTMMIGASLGHVKTNNRNLDRDVTNFYKNLSKNVWTDDNINYAKDIK